MIVKELKEQLNNVPDHFTVGIDMMGESFLGDRMTICGEATSVALFKDLFTKEEKFIIEGIGKEII